MNIEKLKAIRAKCVELLNIASERSAGVWKICAEEPLVFCGNNCIADLIDDKPAANADFISVCAGAAEAGWRATIAAIDQCVSTRPDTPCWEFIAKPLIREILTTWEGIV